MLTSTLGGPTALPHECKPEVPAYKNYEGVVVMPDVIGCVFLHLALNSC